IFGGGNYAHVYRTGDEAKPDEAGNVTVNISGGTLEGAVFGGGNGNLDVEYAKSIYPKVAGDVRITLTGGRFAYSTRPPRYTTVHKRYYGIAAGGMKTSVVRGNTYLRIEANPIVDEFRFDERINMEDDVFFCAGGFERDATVVGRANLILNSKNAPKLDRVYAGGIYGPVGSTDTQVLSGSAERIYAAGRYGSINSDKVNISVGTDNDDFGLNYTINIDNLFGGYDLSKTHIKLRGGNVLNVLRAE
ncbi:MAG: hypothetical protein J6W69_05715, partial [Bacteroidales bacterium]|nr:hypothetical protein [Bacteroidales bacterium]